MTMTPVYLIFIRTSRSSLERYLINSDSKYPVYPPILGQSMVLSLSLNAYITIERRQVDLGQKFLVDTLWIDKSATKC